MKSMPLAAGVESTLVENGALAVETFLASGPWDLILMVRDWLVASAARASAVA